MFSFLPYIHRWVGGQLRWLFECRCSRYLLIIFKAHMFGSAMLRLLIKDISLNAMISACVSKLIMRENLRECAILDYDIRT